MIVYLKDGLKDVLGPTELQVPKSFLLIPQFPPFNGWRLSTPLVCLISWKCHRLGTSWKLIPPSRQSSLTKGPSHVPARPLRLSPSTQWGCRRVSMWLEKDRNSSAQFRWR